MILVNLNSFPFRLLPGGCQRLRFLYRIAVLVEQRQLDTGHISRPDIGGVPDFACGDQIGLVPVAEVNRIRLDDQVVGVFGRTIVSFAGNRVFPAALMEVEIAGRVAVRSRILQHEAVGRLILAHAVELVWLIVTRISELRRIRLDHDFAVRIGLQDSR